MKKTLLVALLTVGVVASALSQGSVNFNNVNSGAGLRAPIYGPEVGDPAALLKGNTSAGLPAGSTVYTGPLLTGAGYSAQLWAAPGNDQAEASLKGAANAVTTFRAPGNTAGFVNAIGVYTLEGVAKDAAAATLQMRVWDNAGGTVTSWDAAVARGSGFGKSDLFNVAAIGGDFNVQPLPLGLRSFNVNGGSVVPEPSSFALAGLGAAALLIFRRRK